MTNHATTDPDVREKRAAIQSVYEQLFETYVTSLKQGDSPLSALLNQHYALPRNAHYTCLDRYESLLDQRSSLPPMLIGPFGTLARLWKARNDQRGADHVGRLGTARILFVSHFLGKPQAKDSYFGDLLAAGPQGYETGVLYLNHTWTKAVQYPQASLGDADGPRILIPRGLPLGLALKRLWKLRNAARRIARHAPSGTMAAHIRANALDPQNVFTIALLYHARQILRTLQPQLLVLTWEGHAWERALIACAREACPGIDVIAYHHGPVSPMTVAAARPTVSTADPDALMVTGDWVTEQYRSSLLWHDKPIAVVGSPRARRAQPLPVADGSTLLVLPEGVHEETIMLFGLAMEALSRDPTLQVILRTHPKIDADMVLKQLPEIRQHGSRLRLSQSSLQSDIAASRWMLYRGSTTAYEGLQSGLRPLLFIDKHDPYPLDCLQDARPWQIRVADAGDIVHAMGEDRREETERRERLYRDAIEHADQLVRPLDIDRAKSLFESFLSKDRQNAQ